MASSDDLLAAIRNCDVANIYEIIKTHPELLVRPKGRRNSEEKAERLLHSTGALRNYELLVWLIIGCLDLEWVAKQDVTAEIKPEDGYTVSLFAWTLRAFGAQWPSGRYSGRQGLDIAKDLEAMEKTMAIWQPETVLLPRNGIRRVRHLLQFVEEKTPGKVNFPKMLLWASEKGKLNLCEYAMRVLKEDDLYVHGLETKDSDGWTALHRATDGGQGAVIKRLVEEGSNLDARAAWPTVGLTPLHLAASRGRPRAVRALLESGAELYALTEKGESSYQWARVAADVSPKTLEVMDEYIRRMSALDFGTLFSKLAEDDRAHVLELISMDVGTLATGESQAQGPRSAPPHDPLGPAQFVQSEQTDQIVEAYRSNYIDSHSGGFDGDTFSASVPNTDLIHPIAFDMLISTIQDDRNFRFQDADKPVVKIAILDTGLDLTHRDWQQGRIVRFENGNPVNEDSEPLARQWMRIRDFRNFCGDAGAQRDVTDLDGHGTQVAGIILRLAPRADIYVARVCEGNRTRGMPGTDHLASGIAEIRRPLRPEAIVEAIDWAIDQGVHLINMSLGFTQSNYQITEALERAKAAKIVVFAAMCNDGNNRQGGAAWPAREPSLAIGVHSCKDHYGRDRSGFTPPPVPKSDNFMFTGENIVTHWPESKGGGFRVAGGTSFSTPAVTAIAALILAFVWQKKCKKDREDFDRAFGKDAISSILKVDKMAKVLEQISQQEGNYSWVHPGLLWKDFNPRIRMVQDTADERQRYAWEVIRTALGS